MRIDEPPYQVPAILIVQNYNFDSPDAKKLFVSTERIILTNDHPGDTKLQDRSSAHHARTERRIQRRVRIRSLSASVYETVHLAVENCVAALNALVVALSHSTAVPNKHRPHRNPPLRETRLRFVARNVQIPSIGRAVGESVRPG
jgi:hypothetical protein